MYKLMSDSSGVILNWPNIFGGYLISLVFLFCDCDVLICVSMRRRAWLPISMKFKDSGSSNEIMY